MALASGEAWRRAEKRFGRGPYGLTEWDGPRRVCSWGAREGDDVDSISLEHGLARIDNNDPFVWVDTSLNGADDLLPIAGLVRGGLENILTRAWTEDDTAQRRRARRAKPYEQAILVNGVAEAFTAVSAGDNWSAYHCVDGLAITVTARGVSPGTIALATANESDYLRP